MFRALSRQRSAPRILTLVLILAAVVAGCAPRATLTPVSDSLAPIATAFNAAAAKPRIVALFSPT